VRAPGTADTGNLVEIPGRELDPNEEGEVVAVNLRFTQVTDAGVAELQKTLPNYSILSEPAI